MESLLKIFVLTLTFLAGYGTGFWALLSSGVLAVLSSDWNLVT